MLCIQGSLANGFAAYDLHFANDECCQLFEAYQAEARLFPFEVPLSSQK
jgi:hypothetical protein